MYLHSDWKVFVCGEMRLQDNDLKVGTDHFPIGGLDHQGPVARHYPLIVERKELNGV